jgi:hypothetical protein
MASAIGDLVINFLGNTTPLDKSIASTKNRITSFVGDVRGSLMSMSGLGGLLTGAGIVAGITKSVQLAGEQVKVEKKLAAVITATGGAAGFTAKQLFGYASALQGTTNFGDEATISAMAVLATFREIKGFTFIEAIKSAQDMSAVLGTDLQASVLQVGKALQSPTDGITALKRAGVSFSDEQRKQIKLLDETGQRAKAQQIILAELKGEFGGAADAMASPVTQFKNALGDLGEEIGKKLLPYVRSLASLLKDDLANPAGLQAFGDSVSWIADRFSDVYYYATKLSAWNMRSSKEKLENSTDMGFTFTADQWRTMQQERADLLREINTKLPKLDADIAAMDAARAKGSFSDRMKASEAAMESARGKAGELRKALDPVAEAMSHIGDASRDFEDSQKTKIGPPASVPMRGSAADAVGLKASIVSTEEFIGRILKARAAVGALTLAEEARQRLDKGDVPQQAEQIAEHIRALEEETQQKDAGKYFEDLQAKLRDAQRAAAGMSDNWRSFYAQLDKGIPPALVPQVVAATKAMEAFRLQQDREREGKSLAEQTMTSGEKFSKEASRIQELLSANAIPGGQATADRAVDAARKRAAGGVLDSLQTPADKFRKTMWDAFDLLKNNAITQPQYQQYYKQQYAEYQAGQAAEREKKISELMGPEAPQNAGALEVGTAGAWSAIMTAMGQSQRADEKAYWEKSLQAQSQIAAAAQETVKVIQEAANSEGYDPFSRN